jgi:hypothetical protein
MKARKRRNLWRGGIIGETRRNNESWRNVAAKENGIGIIESIRRQESYDWRQPGGIALSSIAAVLNINRKYAAMFQY